MWSHGVVVDAPGLDKHARFDAIAEPFEVQALVAKAPIEAFIGAVLPRLTWVDERDVDLLFVCPGRKRVGNELGSVVAANVSIPLRRDHL